MFSFSSVHPPRELLPSEVIAVNEEGKAIQNEIALAKQLEQNGNEESCADHFEHQTIDVRIGYHEVIAYEKEEGDKDAEKPQFRGDAQEHA